MALSYPIKINPPWCCSSTVGGKSLILPNKESAHSELGRAPTCGRVGLYHAAEGGRVTKPPSASRPFG
jgi:hypothetical protein